MRDYLGEKMMAENAFETTESEKKTRARETELNRLKENC